MITFFCPSCKLSLRHPTPGDKVVCPKCGQKIRVPAPPAPPPSVNRTVLGELGSPQPQASGAAAGTDNYGLRVEESAAIGLPPPRAMVPPDVAGPVPASGRHAWPGQGAGPRRRRGRKKWLIGGLAAGSACLVLVLAVVLWKVLFGRAGLTDERRYLPDGSRILVSVNVRSLLGSSAGQKLLASGPWHKLNQQFVEEQGADLERFVEKHTGIPPRDVSRITVAASFGSEDEPVFVFKVKSARRLRLQERRKGVGPRQDWPLQPVTFEEETVGRYTLMKQGSTAYCVPDGETIVVGPVRTLRAVLRRDKEADLPRGMAQALGRLDFSNAVAAAVSLEDLGAQEREVYDREFRREVGRKLPGLAGTLTGASLQADVGARIDVQVALVCTDAAAAASAAEELNHFLKEFRHDIGGEEDVPAAFLKILESVQFTASGTQVSAFVRIDPADVIQMSDELLERNRRKR